MSDDAAKIEITASTSRLQAGLRAAAAQIKRFAVAVSPIVAKGASAINSGVGSMVGNVASAGASKAMDFVADQARSVYTFEESLTRLGIAGSLSADKLDEIRSASFAISKDLGINRQTIIEGAQAYVDLTGDVGGATSSMETFARISQASGASVADVATAAAAFKGIGVPLEGMEARFSGLIQQGKSGAVSLKDFAGELSSLAPKWAKFNEGTSDAGLNQFGAVFQVARQGFGSASEAATGMQAMMGAIVQNATKFEAAGVKIFDRNPKTGVKTLRSFEQIMSGIEKSKLVADPTLMTKALGSKEAEQTVTMLLKARMHIDGAASDYDNLVAAGGKANAVQEDLDTYMTSTAGRMSKAWEGVKNAVAEAMTPDRIETFVEIVEGAASAIGAVIDGLGELKDYLTGKTEYKENPYEKEMKEKMTRQADAGDVFADGFGPDAIQKMRNGVATTMDPIEQRNLEAKRQAYDSEMSAIEGAGTKKQKIRAALEASVKGMKGFDPNAEANDVAGVAGARKAGELYLATAGVKDSEREKFMDEAKWKLIGDNVGKAISEKLGPYLKAEKETKVEVDGNNIMTASKKSTNARRRP